MDLINGGEKSADFKNIADVVNKSFEQIEQNSRTDETVTGLASGFPALDNLTTGFHDGEMVIIAAVLPLVNGICIEHCSKGSGC